jgi:hypothetical protein
MMSPPVPGASGTTAWIGFDGQFAAAFGSAAAPPHAAAQRPHADSNAAIACVISVLRRLDALQTVGGVLHREEHHLFVLCGPAGVHRIPGY